MARAQVLSVVVVAAFAAAVTLAAQDARTQWDGVYTKAQAAAGGTLYEKYCASCHGADLSGGELAPALAGGDFNANWNDLSLGGLFDRMRVSMPQNNPGSLGADDNAQILAFLLSKGGFPAGDTELPAQTGRLGTIRFAALRPER